MNIIVALEVMFILRIVMMMIIIIIIINLTPWPLVRERIIPTERPPLVDEILMPTFVDRRVSRGQSSGSPTVVNIKNKLWHLDRNLTIPTERPPLISEFYFQICGKRGIAWSARRFPTAVNLGFLDRNRYFFFQVAPRLSSRG
jgi:hypothetical protein